MKICNKCKEEKLESEFYFKKRKYGEYVAESICKKCIGEAQKIKNKIKTDAIKSTQVDIQHKCEKCGEIKPIKMFYNYSDTFCRSCLSIRKNTYKKTKVTEILKEIREEKPALTINMSKHILFSKKLADALAEGLAEAFIVLADYIKEEK